RLTKVDSSHAEFDVHLVTLGPPATTISRRFTAEYGLPARIRDISGKGQARYELVIAGEKTLEIDTSVCWFDHRAEGTFKFLPTAHTDLYFVTNSLGDYYFDAIKDLFETDYRAFHDLFNLTLPGKYNIFVCPCLVPSVIWDRRFGMSVDPTRSAAFVLFSQTGNSADPFALLQTAVLRNMGYAPAFLSEGLAGYFSFSLFDMKRLVAAAETVPLRNLLTTADYFAADPVTADRMSASFVKFLIDIYGFSEFRELYRRADDLNLTGCIEQVYGKKVATLEAEWRHYIDTAVITAEQLRGFAERAEQMQDYGLMLRYAQAYLKQSETPQDSLLSLYLLKRAYFFAGDYYRATEITDKLMELQPESARNWMERAAYRMMNGYYEQAREDLLQARKIDTSDQFVLFNLALNSLFTGDQETAGKLLLDLVTSPSMPASRESRIFLADLLRSSDDENDRAMAITLLREVINLTEQELRIHRASSSGYLWSGIAYLGLGDTEQASEFLNVALFLETRPFYIGMIYLSLGKVADALGDRTAARDFYGRVLAVQSAHYHQQEARRYLENPYRP
ncbi:MAG: hypothetical protein AB1744_05760, partial [Candidatus Zixiibacteriota bacterium]